MLDTARSGRIGGDHPIRCTVMARYPPGPGG